MLRVLLVCLGALTLGACGDDPPPKRPTPPKSKTAPASKAAPKTTRPAPTFELAALPIVHQDFKASIQAPKGAQFTADAGTLEVKLADGKQFWLQMQIGAPDLKALLAEAKKNTVQTLVKVHTESDDTLIYETKAFGRTSFWLDTAVRVGARMVHCYSGRGGHAYGQGHIAAFEKACKSLVRARP